MLTNTYIVLSAISTKKFEKPKISHVFEKILFLSIIFNKYKNGDKKY